MATATPDRARLVRWQLITLALLVFGYAGCYLCRSNLSVALPAIQESLVERGYTSADARIALGAVATLGVLAYTIGKFVTGSLADFLGGRRNMLAGMLGSVLFTGLFALAGGVPLFSLAWFGNRAAQSLCWTGMVKITGRWFSYSQYGRAMGVISLSYVLGDAAARPFMGALFGAGLGWREVFWVAGGVLFVLFVLNLVFLRENPGAIGEQEPEGNPKNVFGQGEHDSTPPPDLKSLLGPLVRSREFLVACVLSLGLTILRETFNFWTPTYFVDVVGSSTAVAAVQSMVFPLLGAVSVILAGWLADRLGNLGRAAVILAGCSLSVVVLVLLGSLNFETGAVAPVVLVALVGFLMLGPYSYLAGAISLDLGGKRGGATACGIIDGVGYLGSIAAPYTVARLSVAFGWGGAFQALAGVAVLTSIAAAVFYSLERRKLALAGSP